MRLDGASLGFLTRRHSLPCPFPCLPINYGHLLFLYLYGLPLLLTLLYHYSVNSSFTTTISFSWPLFTFIVSSCSLVCGSIQALCQRVWLGMPSGTARLVLPCAFLSNGGYWQSLASSSARVVTSQGTFAGTYLFLCPYISQALHCAGSGIKGQVTEIRWMLVGSHWIHCMPPFHMWITSSGVRGVKWTLTSPQWTVLMGDLVGGWWLMSMSQEQFSSSSDSTSDPIIAFTVAGTQGWFEGKIVLMWWWTMLWNSGWEMDGKDMFECTHHFSTLYVYPGMVNIT